MTVVGGEMAISKLECVVTTTAVMWIVCVRQPATNTTGQ